MSTSLLPQDAQIASETAFLSVCEGVSGGDQHLSQCIEQSRWPLANVDGHHQILRGLEYNKKAKEV